MPDWESPELLDLIEEMLGRIDDHDAEEEARRLRAVDEMLAVKQSSEPYEPPYWIPAGKTRWQRVDKEDVGRPGDDWKGLSIHTAVMARAVDRSEPPGE